MASKTIDHLALQVGVTPYEHEGNSYDALRVSVMYQKGYGFYVSWMPVKLTQYGYQTGSMPSQDPLVGGGRFIVERVQKNNSKRLTEMHAALELAQEGIALYFDKRLFEQMNDFMKYVALYGYTPHYQQQVENLKAAAAVAPVMRQYNDLKKQKPDSLLLFRCGDFYEAYEQDALDVVKILDTALSKSRAAGNAYDMVGFPHYALDAYLPKLVRAGRRVAICDQINENTNEKTLEDKTMKTNENNIENENVQNAQVNNNVTTEADVAEVSDIVPVVTKKKETHPQPLPVSEGSEKPTAKVEPIGEHGTLVVGGCGLTPKKEEDTKPRFDLEKDKGYRVVLVPAKDGSGEWPKLYGFQTEEEAEKIVGKMAKSIRNSWDRDEKNEKRFYIKGGKKYCEVFQRLCDALNAGNKAAIDAACKDSVAVYEGAVANGKQKREAAREARNSEEGKVKSEEFATAQPTMDAKEQAVFELFKKFMAGDATAMQQIGAMMAKQAA